MGIAAVALLAYLPSWGLSLGLGALGFFFALPGLRSRDRSRAVAWIALILNAVLFGCFVWLVFFYDWGVAGGT